MNTETSKSEKRMICEWIKSCYWEERKRKVKSIRYKKMLLHIGIAVSMLVFMFIITGCSDDPQGSTTNQSTLSETGMSQSEMISPTPVPTGNENGVFEQIDAKSFLTVVNGKSSTVVLGKKQAFEIQGVLDSVNYAVDSSKAAMLFDRNEEGTGRLVFVDGAVDVEVAVDVESFWISSDGSTIAYLSGSFVDGVGCDLCVYDCETGASRLISENSGRFFTLSPKGDAIAFTVYDEPGNADSWVCNVSVDGDTPKTIAKDIYPCALTEDGSLVYTIRLERGDNDEIANNDLSVFHDSKETLLSESLYASTYMNILFNEDCTQILYSDADGICFSQDGEEAILIEPYAKLALTNASCKTEVRSISDDIQYVANYSGTKNLYNVLQMIVYENSDIANLWYFMKNDHSIVLTTIWRKTGFVQVENSILTSDQENLIYNKDIYAPKYEDNYDTSDEKHFEGESGSNFVLTTNDTIYYSSAGGTSDENYRYQMSSMQADGSSVAVLVSSSCVRMDKLEREGEPDIIYFLAYSEPESIENEKLYISQYYYDLYMIEDVPGATPVLISENVGDFGVGDYGVFYLQLKDVAPILIQYYSGEDNNYDESNDILDEDIYDQNKLYYSANGKSFEYVTDIGRRYLYGG